MANGEIRSAEAECCQRWFGELEPHDRSALGPKHERHTCPTCKRAYRVRFESVVSGDAILWSVVTSELAATRRLPGRGVC
jgi:hypothetical protein